MTSGRLLLVSNRLPYSAQVGPGGVVLERSVGGLATGLCPVHEGGTGWWIGWPGRTDGLDEAQRAGLEKELLSRRLLAVELSTADMTGFYDGFSNGVLWPLFHYLTDRIPLVHDHWESYVDVNRRYADAVARAYEPGDTIWVHDFQLLLVPALLRERLPGARIGFFLHIPFPAPEVFALLPWRKELLRGLLGADLVGFHTFSYLRHFLACATQLCAAEIKPEGLVLGSRRVETGVFPMGVDGAGYAEAAQAPTAVESARNLRSGGQRLVVGVDRLDYTKGIPRRLLAIRHVLETTPDLVGKLKFVQVATPSRVAVPAYEAFKRELDELVGNINGRFGTAEWTPVHYLHRSLPMDEVVALYLAADVLMVTPLRDGMNLVAKEFVATRGDGRGVLVLSEFAGAADELGEAVVVNPYDVVATAAAVVRALSMGADEQEARMVPMRQRVLAHDVHGWVNTFLRRLGHAGSTRVEPADPLELARQVAARARKAGKLVLFLDYDGTLVPFAPRPEDARPDAGLRTLLERLCALPASDVHVVSGRPPVFLADVLGGLDAALHGEHGWWTRARGSETWTAQTDTDMPWRHPVRRTMEQFCGAVGGSFVEEKSTCLAWHHRGALPHVGDRMAGELCVYLRQVLSNAPVEVLLGHKTVEVRAQGANKGRVVRQVLAGDASAYLVALGDDRTDEDMFAAIPAARGESVCVGDRRKAQHSLPDVAAARAFLDELCRAWTG